MLCLLDRFYTNLAAAPPGSGCNNESRQPEWQHHIDDIVDHIRYIGVVAMTNVDGYRIFRT